MQQVVEMPARPLGRRLLDLSQSAWSQPSCSARLRNRKSMRFPSCGCSQLSFVVGIGPRLSRSMCVAFVAAAAKRFVVGDHRADQRRADRLSISSCGHSTTAANGNMYSFWRPALRAMARGRSSAAGSWRALVRPAAGRTFRSRALRPASCRSCSICFQTAAPMPGTVNAARPALGSSGGNSFDRAQAARPAPRRFRACAAKPKRPSS